MNKSDENTVLLSMALDVMRKQVRTTLICICIFCIVAVAMLGVFYYVHVTTIHDILSTQWEVTETRDEVEIKQHTDGNGTNHMSNITIGAGS